MKTGFAARCVILLYVLAILTCVGMFPVRTAEAEEDAWQGAYRQLFISGNYNTYLRAVNPEYAGMLAERDTQWDSVALHDMDGDGTPELILRTDYAIEQADVFIFLNGGVYWVGTMGGDNFFQWILSYRNSGYQGLFTVTGGPAMSVTRYTLENGYLSRQEIAQTLVSKDGDDTVGVRMYVEDGMLYQLLDNTFVNGQDASEEISWYIRQDLQSDADWSRLFAFW